MGRWSPAEGLLRTTLGREKGHAGYQCEVGFWPGGSCEEWNDEVEGEGLGVLLAAG